MGGWYRVLTFDRRVMAAPETVVRLDEKFAAFDDLWTPKIVG
jgi:hypothetical protein